MKNKLNKEILTVKNIDYDYPNDTTTYKLINPSIFTEYEVSDSSQCFKDLTLDKKTPIVVWLTPHNKIKYIAQNLFVYENITLAKKPFNKHYEELNKATKADYKDYLKDLNKRIKTTKEIDKINLQRKNLKAVDTKKIEKIENSKKELVQHLSNVQKQLEQELKKYRIK